MTTTLHLLGAGRAGTGLARLLAARGHTIGRVVTTREATASAAVTRIGAGVASLDMSTLVQDSCVILVCVPDRRLAALALQLAMGNPVQDCVVLHLSGALPADVLAPLRRRGAAVGKMHPMFSFASLEQPTETLAGVGFAIHGDPPALLVARRLVTDLDGVAFELTDGADALHHAACSVAANALVTVFQLACDLERAAGLSPEVAAQTLLPLVQSAVKSLRDQGSPAALTGPIERADVDVLRQHLLTIRRHAPTHVDLYRSLALATVEVARAKGSVSEEQATAMIRLLEETR